MCIVSIFVSACSNTSVMHAPNGKIYYIDGDDCDIYTLNRDTLYCYDSENETIQKVYKPVTFGYDIGSREGY